MRTQTKLTIFAPLVMFSGLAFGQCPVPPTAIDPKLEVSTELDKKTSSYTYTYKVSNSSRGKVGIFLINLESSQPPVPVFAPKKWDIKYYEKENPSTVHFFSAVTEITPNNEPYIFKFQSNLPPGLIRYYAEGSVKGELKAEPVNGDPEAEPDCPGFFFNEKKVLDQRVTGITIGPAPANQIDVKVKMKVKKVNPAKGEDDEADEPEISSIAKGKIEVIVHGVKGIDLGTTDLNSIRFGPAKAKPLSVKILSPSQQAYGWKKAPDEKSQRLWMEFNLADLQIRCELDKALFFSAKAGNKVLFGAAAMKPVLCTKEIWKQMRIERKWDDE